MLASLRAWLVGRKRPHLIAAIRLRCDHWGIAEWEPGRDTTRTRCPTCNRYGEVTRP